MKNIFPYAAGYIDGDGCLYAGIYKQKNSFVYEQSIQIVSVKKTVLQVFQSHFGGYIRKKPYKPNHKDAYCWTLKGQKTIDLCNQICPFLIEKIEQANLFVALYALIKKNNFAPVAAHDVEIRKGLLKQIKQEKTIANLINQADIQTLQKIKYTIQPTESDFAYLAGLIDAEGCFRIKKWKPKNAKNFAYVINLEIGNTKFPIFPWLASRFGGSVVFIAAKNNKKAVAVWSLSSAKLFAILDKILPYLISKKCVCEKLIEFQNTILPNGGDRHSSAFYAFYAQQIQKRERIVSEVHVLNRKGH